MGDDILIVDGYNIINAWPELVALKDESFEHARIKLLDIMTNFQGMIGGLVLVVFDAHQVKKGLGVIEDYGGVQVIFTREGETADSCIERLVSLIPRGTRVTVATSDWAEQRLVMGQGALRLSAREFLMQVNEVRRKMDIKKTHPGKNSITLDDVIDSEIKDTLERWRRSK
ncbi:NYN domain-containing protein [Dehalobacterium formicoaceticum]|uniref:NYN domain-containing protein n=1 Tax=Dehalobacterium formicoaceticum TaxID=51515 RepID=A0ABT1XZ90_9FIRM|nr:NYN domain-containing protein [Dehalobacterium formicoaceticum]MCR6543935.1 NYN domain-containing protein [Dehalobacterium formicoaceticum]